MENNDKTVNAVVADQQQNTAVKKRPRKRVEKSVERKCDVSADEQKAGLAQAILAAYNATSTSNESQAPQQESSPAVVISSVKVEDGSEQPKPKVSKPKKSSAKTEGAQKKASAKIDKSPAKPTKTVEGEEKPKEGIAQTADEKEQKPALTKKSAEKQSSEKPAKEKRSIPDSENEPPAKRKKPSTSAANKTKKTIAEETAMQVEEPKPADSSTEKLEQKEVDFSKMSASKRKRIENKEKRRRIKEEAKSFALPKGVPSNLTILIRHQGKISFAKPIVLEWSPLPVTKSKTENPDEEEKLVPATTKEPTEQYQYLRVPASQDYEISPLGCQLINLNFGLQFADKEFTQLCNWSVHNWEPLLNEGLVVHYAEPIQQNIQLLVQNCGDRNILIKQGEPLAVIRFHPLPRRLTLRYVESNE